LKTKAFWLVSLCVLFPRLSLAQSPQPGGGAGKTRPWILPSDVSILKAPRRARTSVNTSISTCNNNGICEPWLGDSCTTCADCIGNAQCAQLAQVCNWYNFVGGNPGPIYDQCLNGTYSYLYYHLRYLAEKYAAPGSNIVNEPGTPFAPGDGKCNQTPDPSIESGSCGGFPRESCANDPQDCGPCPAIGNITDSNIDLGSCDASQCSKGVCTLGQCSTASACQFNCDSAHYGGTGGANTTQSDAVDFAIDATTCSSIAAISNSICPPGGANFVSYSLETPGTLHVSANTLTGSFPSVPDSTGATPVACPSRNGGPPSFRAWLAGSAINDILFAIGGGICNTCVGFGGSEVRTAEGYDTTSGAWYTKGSLQTARFGLSATTVNGKIYALGGTSGNQSFPVSTVEEYDPGADLWLVKTNMPTPRWKVTSSTVNGTIYTIGGGATGNQCSPTGTVEAYDPIANAWTTTKKPMPTARWGAASDVLNGQIYVAGGSQSCPQGSVIVSFELEVYDPSADAWTSKMPMPTARWDLAAAAVNGKLYAIGGWDAINQTALDVVEEFDPATNSWSTKSHMPTKRSGLTAATINGKIYAFGGVNQFNQLLSTLEIYDPTTDTWTTASPPPLVTPPSVTLISPPSGDQGATIPNSIVVGSNFDPNATLSFSGTGMTVNSYGSRTTAQMVANITIATTTPLGAHDVMVTNPDGHSGLLSGGFTVLAPPPPLTGTINVTTNTPSATFTVAGPTSFSGSGTSDTFVNAPPGDYQITYGPNCRSDLPTTQTQTLTAGGTTSFVGTYKPGFLSNFPLAALDPCTATINAVFDHSQKGPYRADFKVVSYTGENGLCNSNNPAQSFQSVVGLKHPLYGYRNQTGSAFTVNGNYTGGENGNGSLTITCAKTQSSNLPSDSFLYYDGHPGYDYKAPCGTPVRAAVSGTIVYPASIPGVPKNAGMFHVLELDPDAPNNGYKIYYLHLSTYPPSKYSSCKSAPPIIPVSCNGKACHVNAGQVIGNSGDAGVPGSPHLHFEIQTNPGIPVDPYGWKGAPGADPYKRAPNVNLWP